MTSPDSPSPRTAVSDAARRTDDEVAASNGYGDLWAKHFLDALSEAGYEVRAAQEAPAPEGLPRGVLLREIDDARNAGIRPAGGDELRAWNYLLDHFEQFVKGWPFPSPAEPPRRCDADFYCGECPDCLAGEHPENRPRHDRAEARPPEGLDADRLAGAIDTVAPQRMWPVRGVHEVSAAEFADSIAAEYARLSARGAEPR